MVIQLNPTEESSSTTCPLRRAGPLFGKPVEVESSMRGTGTIAPANSPAFRGMPMSIDPQSAPRVTARTTMTIAGEEVQLELTVPAGPIRPRDLLPVLDPLADLIVDIATRQVEQQGKQISCQKGCGACCRQLVPLAPADAYRIRQVVEQLPDARRIEVERRFAEAREKLQAAGMWDRLQRTEKFVDDRPIESAMEYFRLGIPCPFLEEESCSIHADRPITCREYLVTSPAIHCAAPTKETIETVPMPAKVWTSLARLEGGSDPKTPWVPLIGALEWTSTHPEPAADESGPQLLQRYMQTLSGKPLE